MLLIPPQSMVSRPRQNSNDPCQVVGMGWDGMGFDKQLQQSTMIKYKQCMMRTITNKTCVQFYWSDHV